jgi:hypothetical protein
MRIAQSLSFLPYPSCFLGQFEVFTTNLGRQSSKGFPDQQGMLRFGESLALDV